MDEITDFLCQMEIATLEEAPLYEISKGSVDLVAGGPVSHGPWPRAACAAVLKRWYEAGWIGLYLPDYPSEWNLMPGDWCARMVDGSTLAPPDALRLLDEPGRWILGHTDGHIAPYQTEAGWTASWQEWFDNALETAQQLLLREPDSKS